MKYETALDVVNNNGQVGIMEISPIDEVYTVDYPNGWWRWLFNGSEGMPIQKAVLFPMLLKENPEEELIGWMSENF